MELESLDIKRAAAEWKKGGVDPEEQGRVRHSRATIHQRQCRVHFPLTLCTSAPPTSFVSAILKLKILFLPAPECLYTFTYKHRQNHSSKEEDCRILKASWAVFNISLINRYPKLSQHKMQELQLLPYFLPLGRDSLESRKAQRAQGKTARQKSTVNFANRLRIART